ncbi:MAG: DUF3810 domain-containing protein [Clostridia bacterium]|nr:DUF3810 domain-containing protein [Clostridia bacterium]
MARREENNEKLARIGFRRTVNRFVAAAILFALAGLCAALCRSEGFVDRYYRPVSRFVMNIFAWVTGFVPFSVAEILVYLLVLTVAVSIVWLLKVVILGPDRLSRFMSLLSRGVLLLSAVLFIFYGFWAGNYNAPKLASTLGYDDSPKEPTRLYALNLWLAERVNELAPLAHEGGEPSFRELAKTVAAEFERTTDRPEIAAKYVLASEPMSHTRITGMFTPYTGEANVNSNNTLTDLPFTMAHEMAHRYGIAREDEANFYAWYVLWDAEDPLLAYSAALMSLLYTQNSLTSANVELAADVASRYNDIVREDIRQYALHWSQYEGKAAEVADVVNDSYLKGQGQSDGVKSYGRMTDLLLGWYEQEIATD